MTPLAKYAQERQAELTVHPFSGFRGEREIQQEVWYHRLIGQLINLRFPMREITLRIEYKEYEAISNVPEQEYELIMRARQAAKSAYAPYSGFRVGAAVQLANGQVVTGSNQENAAYPSGLCAERTALFYASAQYPGEPIVAIAVSTINGTATASEIAKPCGACRQVMAEYEDLARQPLKIILDSKDTVLVMSGIDSLLPLRFKKEDVK